ncbi:hypothetical protein BEL04_14610 [Mucilaginibacter sp. PPCGB 2223]|uniref:hypothetical protein n=1 Tax=Mucilaginibacter sp. PPCGB 2223 TaxID=1886027 RepID=UPI0008265D22|nr:hypothetical protein [Mucilaginibacter sp. PPCGB 2223]OCX52675.1 hypothetical protein BEL04_14610 [Mucilaginibacter sp. PPCGB 2223]
MLPIKLNGNPYNFPTEANEISLGQFFALRQSKGILDEICALTGMDRQSVQNFKGRDDLDLCRLLLNTLGEKLSKGIEGKKLPKQTTIAGKKVTVPKNLKLEPVGAFIAVHNLISEEQKRSAETGADFDPTDIIPQVLAHYFWLPYMGDGVLYSDEKIDDEAYMEQILTIPVTDAVPIANFFFRKYPNL